MAQEKSKLQNRIESGKPIILSEIAPPKSADAGAVRAVAKQLSGKVHALGVSDNRERLGMSAIAAASLVAAEGVEPILHMATRDRNRTALISDCLGAHALGIRNLLCTSGTHQSLLPFHTAKNVFDIDATILLQTCKGLAKSEPVVGEDTLLGPIPFCLGAVASPNADPLELQVSRLAQKISVGAQFVVTHSVFDLERFGRWWKEIVARQFHQNTAFIAGIRILTDAESAKAYAEKRPFPLVSDETIARLQAKSGNGAARAEGIKIALETITALSKIDGLRGFEIVCDEDPKAVAEVLDSLKSKLG